jgi:hypothetical protein
MNNILYVLIFLVFLVGFCLSLYDLVKNKSTLNLFGGLTSTQSNNCYTSLRWPNCNTSSTVKGCSEIVDINGNLKPGYEKETCCLSNSMVKNDLKNNNCPPNWINNPQKDWCTSKFNFFSANQIRHKCFKNPTTTMTPTTTTTTMTPTTTTTTMTPTTTTTTMAPTTTSIPINKIKDITIFGYGISNNNLNGNKIVLSVALDGKINFSQHIERMKTIIIDPNKDEFADDIDTQSNKPSSSIQITNRIIEDYIYIDGIFYIKKIIYQGNTSKQKIQAYDISKGPLPPFKVSNIYDTMKSMNIIPSTIFTSEYMSSFEKLFETVRKNVQDFNKKYNRNIVLTTASDYLQTSWFNVCGIIDRLWLPDGKLNTSFMGFNNINIQNTAIPILTPDWAIKPVDVYTKSIERIDEKGQTVIQDIDMRFPIFTQINPFSDVFTEKNGYDPNLFIKNPTDVRLDPINGINMKNLIDNPLPLINNYMQREIQTLENYLLTNIDNLKYYLDDYVNIFVNKYIDKEIFEKVCIKGDSINGDTYMYLPIILNPKTLLDTIVKQGRLDKNTTLLFKGMIRTDYIKWQVAKSEIDMSSIQKIISELQAKYDACRADISLIKQPFTDGNSCPDSQDAALSIYAYNPAFNCSWARIGDAWTSVETTVEDNFTISEWGKLYHGDIPEYQKIIFTFEGTETIIGDWLSNINVLPVPVLRIGAVVHAGFWNKCQQWIPTILKYLRPKYRGLSPFGFNTYTTWAKKIIFGGHSLGGAQAQLAAAYFKVYFPDAEIEVFSQGAPSPFWLCKPFDYINVNHPKRFKSYFYDECIFNPSRDDPVSDILNWFGFWHWFDFETPARRFIKRKWSWNPFDGGWTRCKYNGGIWDAYDNPESLLKWALNILGYIFAGGIPIGEIVDLVLGAIFEHGMGEYFPKISNTQCNGYWDPNPDVPIR